MSDNAGTLKQWQKYISDYEQNLSTVKQHVDTVLNSSTATDAEKQQALSDYMEQKRYLEWLQGKYAEYQETGEVPADMTIDESLSGDLYRYNNEIKIAEIPLDTTATPEIYHTIATVQRGTTQEFTIFQSEDLNLVVSVTAYQTENATVTYQVNSGNYPGLTIRASGMNNMVVTATGTWAEATGYTPLAPGYDSNSYYKFGYIYPPTDFSNIPTWNDSNTSGLWGVKGFTPSGSDNPSRQIAAGVVSVSIDGTVDNPWDFYDNNIKPEDPENAVFPDGWTPPPGPDDDWDPDTQPDEDPNDYEDKPTSETQPPLFAALGPRYWVMSIDEFRGIYLSIKNIMSQLVLYYNDLSQNLPAALIQTFSGLSTSEETQFKLYSGFAGNNALDAIGSITWYPFDLTKFFQTTNNVFTWGLTTQTDFVSSYTPGNLADPPIPPGTAEQTAKEVTGYWYSGYLLEGGTCTYFKHYESFIDYAPYCDAVLYIPYCGSVHIDPQRFVGHELKLRYLVDFLSGACLALVYRDNLIVDTLPGQMGINIPVSMENFSAYISQVQSANNAMNSAKIGLIGSAVSATTAAAKTINDVVTEVGSGTGVVGAGKALGHNAPRLVNAGLGLGESLNQLSSAQYSLDSAHMTMQAISAGSSALASGNEQTARLVLYQPRWLDGYKNKDYGEYGHTTGFATVENKELKNFTGFTIADSIDTSGISQATEKEKAMIQKAFKGGVYI